MDRRHYDTNGKEKKSFTTFQAALDASAELAGKNHDRRPVNAYQCPICDLYHLGHCRDENDVSDEQKRAQLTRAGWYPLDQADRWTFGNTRGKLEAKRRKERGMTLGRAYKSMLKGKRIQHVAQARRWRDDDEPRSEE